MNCLESIQAMLIAACYSAERSLILSFATRMALDLNMDAAFENLTQRLVMKETAEAYHCCCPEAVTDEERSLVRESRTWFGLLVLEHMYGMLDPCLLCLCSNMSSRFRFDGGKPPGIRLTGSARRCRILLSHPLSTVLDLRLFAQVEVWLIVAPWYLKRLLTMSIVECFER